MKFKSPRKTTSFAKVHEFSKISASSLVHSDFVKLGGGGGVGTSNLIHPFLNFIIQIGRVWMFFFTYPRGIAGSMIQVSGLVSYPSVKEKNRQEKR